MLDRLAGMFAFCLVEQASGRRVLARDRLGIKPLYLCDTPDGGLRFASALPALLAAGGVDTRVDPVALHHYLSFHSIVPAPRTILRGVRKLAPATLLVIEPNGRRRERRYWDPPFERDPAREDWTREEWERAVLDGLRTAVRRVTTPAVLDVVTPSSARSAPPRPPSWRSAPLCTDSSGLWRPVSRRRRPRRRGSRPRRSWSR